MKKTWLKIKKFKFTDLKKRGLKELNKGVFRTSPWINNIVRRKNFVLKKNFFQLNLLKSKLKIWAIQIQLN